MSNALLLATLALTMAAPVPKGPQPTYVVVATVAGDVLKLDATGKEVARFPLKDTAIRMVRLAPDHDRILVSSRAAPNKTTAKLFLRDWIANTATELPEAQHVAACFWLPDGTSVLASGLDIALGNQPQIPRHKCWQSWSVSTATQEVTKIELDGEYRLIGLSWDAKQYIAARTFDPKPVGKGVLSPQLETYLVDRTTLKKQLVIPAERDAMPVAMLPDGTTWLVSKVAGADNLRRFGLFNTKDDSFTELPDQTQPYTYATVSPDGKQILASQRSKGNDGTWTGELFLIDIAGLKSRKFFETNSVILSIDWR